MTRARAAAKKKKVRVTPTPRPQSQKMPGGDTMTTQSGLAMGYGPVVSTLQSATQAANRQAAQAAAKRSYTTRGDPNNAQS
jgi:hypothetical protein